MSVNMATQGHWELVTGKTKKSKQENGQVNTRVSKDEKRKLLENAPKLTDVLPWKDVQTIYSSYDRKAEQPAAGKENRKNEAKQTQKKKQEKKRELKEKSPKSIEEAVRTISLAEMTDLLETVQTRFHDSPIIWLKDLASYLNVKLEVEEKDPVCSFRVKDYPVCLLPQGIQQELLNTIDRCPGTTLHSFFDHLLLSMVNDMTKGLTVLGYKMFLQLLVQHSPGIVSHNMGRCVELLASCQNRPAVALAILVAAGQGGVKNLQVGLRVWLQLMVPLLGARHYSRFVIDYLAFLFTEHCDADSASQVFGVKDFFHVLDIVFSAGTSLQPTLHTQLMGLYPKLKTVAFGSSPELSLRQYFPHFLERLQPSCTGPLREELLTCLVLCLGTDHHCFSVWRQLYTKRIPQSTLLLKHLARTWSDVSPSLPRKIARETVKTFIVTNDEVGKQKKNAESLQGCIIACEELTVKMSSSFAFPWKFGSFLLTLAITGLLVYDIQKNGTFRDSSTGNFLKDIGALHYCEHAWTKTRTYSQKACSWAEDNVPYYYARVSQQVSWLLYLLLEKAVCVGHCLYHSYENIRDHVAKTAPEIEAWINHQIPGFTDWVQSTTNHLWDSGKQHGQAGWLLVQQYSIWAWGICQEYWIWVWGFCQEYCTWAWGFCQQYIHTAMLWLRENIFTGKLSPENLRKYTVEAIDVAHYYVITGYQWILQQAQKVSQ